MSDDEKVELADVIGTGVLIGLSRAALSATVGVVAGVVFGVIVMLLAGCAPAAPLAPPRDPAIERLERETRDEYCFRLAETCEWARDSKEPRCALFCTRGRYEPKK